MTNNCDIATAVGAEELGLAAEIISDATGAIHLANEAGKVSADQLHETLLVLLLSNFAAVATTEAWTASVSAGEALPKSDLGTSALQGPRRLRRLINSRQGSPGTPQSGDSQLPDPARPT